MAKLKIYADPKTRATITIDIKKHKKVFDFAQKHKMSVSSTFELLTDKLDLLEQELKDKQC